MPNGLPFGFELEVATGAQQSLDNLREYGETRHTYFHPYHCDCDECQYTVKSVSFGAQEDCTADGEFISKVHTWGSKRAENAFAALQESLVSANADTTGDVGMHVHVRRPADRRQIPTDIKLAKLFTRYQDDLDIYAAGAHPRVRDYNEKNIAVANLANIKPWRFASAMRRQSNSYLMTDPLYSVAPGTYLRYGARGKTYEFRLWNSTKSAWRMRMNVGMSVAMVRAALYGQGDFSSLPKSLPEFLAPYIDDDTANAMATQVTYQRSL